VHLLVGFGTPNPSDGMFDEAKRGACNPLHRLEGNTDRGLPGAERGRPLLPQVRRGRPAARNSRRALPDPRRRNLRARPAC
jgi:hypothetical protein